MKKFLLLILLAFASLQIYSQVIGFIETFEPPSGADSVVSTGTTGYSPWGINSRIARTGTQCDSAVVTPDDTTNLTTIAFSTVGNTSVFLHFSQICKIEYMDGGEIWVSNNNGVNWIKLTAAQYMGTGSFGAISDRFTSTSYVEWLPGTATAVPQNSWWKDEVFDISAFASNSAQVKIRFMLRDANLNGAAGSTGWYLDDIKIVMSPSELIPPSLTMVAPIWQDTTYQVGPYPIKARITDISGVDTAYVTYTVNNGSPITLGMTMIGPDTFQAMIPFPGFGRTISYRVTGVDASPAANTTHYPSASGWQWFYCKFSTGGTFIVGTGTGVNTSTSYPAPYGNYWWGARHQFLIRASELQALGAPGGAIGSLAFNVQTVAGTPLQGFSILMGHTAQNTAVSAFAPGLTTVYATTSYTEVPGWNTHTFQTPFVWNGVDNIIVETCFNNSAYTTNAVTYNSTTSFVSTTYYNNDASGICAITSGTTASVRPNMKIEILGVSTVPLDLGVSHLVYPTGGVTANQNFNVRVKLKNFGTDTITSGTINWRLNGTAQTPFSWTGTLYPGDTTSPIIIGNLTLPLGSHSLKIWSDMPNNNFDMNSGNDTVSLTFFACASQLSGTYTIGGTGADFPDFTSAVTGLAQCGISGPVVFNVANGIYNEQIVIPWVSGSSATNTVLFKSASGDSSAVTLRYQANVNNNFTMRLNGTKNIEFRKMTIEAQDTGYARAIVLAGKPEYLTFTGMVIKNSFVSSSTSTASVAKNLVHTIDSAGTNISFLNNLFQNGNIALVLAGNSNTVPEGLLIQGNQFQNQVTGSITITNFSAPQLLKNTINTGSTILGYTGISVNYCPGFLQLLKNKINIPQSMGGNGIVIANSNGGTNALRGTIANNFVRLNTTAGGTTIWGGITVNDSKRQNVHYNNVNITGNYANSAALLLSDVAAGGTTLLRFNNNNLINSAGGFVVYANNVDTSRFTSVTNNMRTSGPVFSRMLTATQANLAAWKAVTLQDVNSISIDPYYVSASDLHVTNNLLNATATNIALITDDIDDQPRHATTPDIGADEFTPSPWDATLLRIVTPVTACGLTNNETVSVVVKNIGNAVINGNISASYKLGSNPQVTEPIVANLSPNDSILFSFTTKANLDVFSLGHDSTYSLVAWVDLLNDPVKANDTAYKEVKSKLQPLAPAVISPVQVSYGSSTVLSVTSPYNVIWYKYDTSTVSLHNGPTYTTPLLYDTTTYYTAVTPAVIGSGGNIALTATASHSGGGSTSYGPTNYNDNIWNAYGNLPWGWVNTNGSIEYTWQTPVTFNKIVFLKDNRPMYTCTVQQWNGSSYVDFYTYNNNATEDSITFPPVTTTKLRFFNIAGSSNPNFREILVYSPAADGCVSDKAPIVVNIINYPTNDAGITRIVNPAAAVPSGVPQPIKVKLKNFGVDTLKTASINWKVNGISKPVYSWTGNLLYKDSVDVTLDTITFSGGIYQVLAYTTLPNGVADTINSNDTAYVNFNACLGGTYTIGDTTGGAPYNFPSFNAARNALVAAGICGNVTFLVASGTYNEQVSFSSIIGANANNKITFRSMSGDSTNVTLQYSATGSTDNYVLRFQTATDITFEKMTIKANGASYGYVVVYDNAAHRNSIKNCIVQTSTTGTSSSFAPIYSTSTQACNYASITNSRLIGGYYGCYWYGSSSAVKKHFTMKNNQITDYYYYGLYTYYTDSVMIESNLITNRSNSGVLYPVYIGYTNGYGYFNKNRVISNGTSTNYGLYLAYKQATSTQPFFITNNMLSQTGNTAGTVYGMYVVGSNYVNIYHNSVRINGGSTTSGRAFYQTSGTFINVVNNIFSNYNGGVAYYVGTPTGIGTSNHNDFYTTGTVLAYWNANHGTLASLQSASLKDANSYTITPPFTSSTDLMLNNTSLSAKGMFLSAVPDDIYGNPRGSITTIGAHEVPLLAIDGGVSAVLLPPATTNEFDTIPVRVIVCNFGTDTLYSFSIAYTVNGGTPVTINYNGILPTGWCDTVYLPSFISPAGSSTLCAYTIVPNDSNTFNNQLCKSFFGTPQKDAQVTRILTLSEGCALTTDTVRIRIKNLGATVINANITASYKVMGGTTVVTQPVSQPIVVNDSILFSFSVPVNLSVTTTDSIFNIKAWVDYIGDNVKYNDTAATSTKSFHIPPAPVVSNITVPYGSPATVTAVSPTGDTLIWFDSPTGGTQLHQGATYTTPIMYTTDTLYVEARGGAPATLMTLGTGTGVNTTTSYPAPYGNYWWGARHQFMVQASELLALGAAAGPISSLAFNVQAVGGAALQGFAIKMGHTTQTAMTTNFATNLTTVYSTGSYSETTGWNTHVFQTPFIWNGTDNILIETCFNNSSYTTNAVVYNTTTSFVSTLYYNNDAAGICSYATGSTSSVRPNMRFMLEPTGCSSVRSPLIITVGNPAQYDAGVYNIVTPVTGVNLTAQETVKVRIKNYGTSTISNFPVSFKVGSQSAVTETVTASINPTDTLEYTFVGKANLGIVGNTYSIKAYTSLTGDNTALNDTTYKSVMNLLPSYCPSNATSPAYEDMTNVTLHTLNNTSLAVGSQYTDFTATVQAPMLSPGMTYTMSISTDFPPGYSYQYSCWVKAWIDFDRDGTFDPVNEMIFSSATTSSATVTGQATIPPTAMTGNTRMRVVFVETSSASSVNPCGTYTWGETEDYMVTIAPQAACDAGLISIIEPTGLTQAGTSLPVWAKFMNFGSDTIPANTLQIAYKLNNGTPVIVAYAPSMPPMKIDSIQMPNINVGMGGNTFCVYTILSCDSNTFNDEKCMTVFGQLQTYLPYTDNFDQVDYFYNGNPTVWERGVPAGTTINAAHSAPNAWMTLLSANYPNSANAYLYTPRFDFTMLGVNDTATLKFWHRMQSESNADGGMLQYTVNGGTTWANLGYMGDPLGTNWYTHNVGGTHAWTGTIPWTQVSFKLDPSVFNQTNPVQFRLRFFSNASNNTYDGWAVDDFQITIPQIANDVGVVVFEEPTDTTMIGSSVTVKIRIKNFGTQPQVSIPVRYKVNNNPVVSATWTGALQPGDTANYTFATPFVCPSTAFNIMSWTALSGDAYAMNDTLGKTIPVKPAPLDIGVKRMIDISYHDTTYTNLPNPYYPQMVVQNYGTTAVSSFTVQFTRNGLLQGSQPVTHTLNPGDSMVVTFIDTIIIPFGWYNICGKTVLTGDADATNDEKCINWYGKFNALHSITTNGLQLAQNRPNPATDYTNIEYSVPKSGKVVFQVHNLMGQLIQTQELDARAGKNEVIMNLQSIPAGVYTYGILYEGFTLSKQLIVVK